MKYFFLGGGLVRRHVHLKKKLAENGVVSTIFVNDKNRITGEIERNPGTDPNIIFHKCVKLR